MLLAVLAVVSALVTPQPKFQSHSQPQPAPSQQSPSSVLKAQPPAGGTTFHPLCQAPGEVSSDGSPCDCPWGVGPENQCLCPPENDSPPAPCTGALRPPLREPTGALDARNNSDQSHSNGAISKAGPFAVWGPPGRQGLTDCPREIMRIDLPHVFGPRT